MYYGKPIGGWRWRPHLNYWTSTRPRILSESSAMTFRRLAFARIEGLDRVPNLRSITLGEIPNHSHVSASKPRHCWRSVNLSQNKIERIEGLQALPELRELYLGRNRIRTIEGLGNLEKLEVLMLEVNEIEEVSGLSHLKSLKRLGLAGNKLRNITGLRGLTSLEEVSIESSRNQLDEASLQFIREWNAEHAGKPSLQLHSGMQGQDDQAAAPVPPEDSEP